MIRPTCGFATAFYANEHADPALVVSIVSLIQGVISLPPTWTKTYDSEVIVLTVIDHDNDQDGMWIEEENRHGTDPNKGYG